MGLKKFRKNKEKDDGYINVSVLENENSYSKYDKNIIFNDIFGFKLSIDDEIEIINRNKKD